MDKHLDAPDWAEFIFNPGWGWYWGSSDRYLSCDFSTSSVPRGRWTTTAYEGWKSEEKTEMIIRQLEND